MLKRRLPGPNRLISIFQRINVRVRVKVFIWGLNDNLRLNLNKNNNRTKHSHVRRPSITVPLFSRHLELLMTYLNYVTRVIKHVTVRRRLTTGRPRITHHHYLGGNVRQFKGRHHGRRNHDHPVFRRLVRGGLNRPPHVNPVLGLTLNKGNMPVRPFRRLLTVNHRRLNLEVISINVGRP